MKLAVLGLLALVAFAAADEVSVFGEVGCPSEGLLRVAPVEEWVELCNEGVGSVLLPPNSRFAVYEQCRFDDRIESSDPRFIQFVSTQDTTECVSFGTVDGSPVQTVSIQLVNDDNDDVCQEYVDHIDHFCDPEECTKECNRALDAAEDFEPNCLASTVPFSLLQAHVQTSSSSSSSSSSSDWEYDDEMENGQGNPAQQGNPTQQGTKLRLRARRHSKHLRLQHHRVAENHRQAKHRPNRALHHRRAHEMGTHHVGPRMLHRVASRAMKRRALVDGSRVTVHHHKQAEQGNPHQGGRNPNQGGSQNNNGGTNGTPANGRDDVAVPSPAPVEAELVSYTHFVRVVHDHHEDECEKAWILGWIYLSSCFLLSVAAVLFLCCACTRMKRNRGVQRVRTINAIPVAMTAAPNNQRVVLATTIKPTNPVPVLFHSSPAPSKVKDVPVTNAVQEQVDRDYALALRLADSP